jgi:hypothetical protein
MFVALATPLPPTSPTPGPVRAAVLTALLLGAGCVGEISGDTGGPRRNDAPASGPPAGGTVAPPCGGDATEARIWRLSDEDYRRAVADLLPGVTVPEVSTPGRSKAEFVNLAELYPVAGALVADLRTAAKTVAAAAMAELPARMACSPGQAERACAEAFIERFATRAYRRALENEDRQSLASLFAAGATESISAGVQLVIEGVLQAPSFLYRTELGPAGAGPRFELTAYERASALSFFLLGSIPDEPLMRAAQDGSLATPDGYAREIQRLLGDARVRQNLTRILIKWTGLGDGVTTELPAEQFPEYDEALKQSMASEAEQVFADLFARGGTFADLLTSRRTFVDKRLAAIYGVPYSGTGAFVPVMLPADQRAGIFTQAAFLLNKSRGEPVVHRGKWVREEILCGEMPEPPPGANTTPPVNPDLTARQFAQMRMDDMNCGACHQLMDGIGLTFGKYDPLARFVTRDDRGRPIDTAGQVEDSDVAGPVGDILQLAQRLAGSRQARACIEAKMLSYALGREPNLQAIACEQQKIDAQIAAGGHRLLDMMGAIALSPAFHARGGGR